MIQCFSEEEARLEAINQFTDYEIYAVRIFYSDKDKCWWVDRLTLEEFNYKYGKKEKD